jgi:DNA/RNA-binding domain of Phe-tRNA-synthetase-like protein
MATFRHAPEVWAAFPYLTPVVLRLRGVTDGPDPSARVAAYVARARAVLDGRTESELPQIQAWRRVYSQMGLKPTQYRCAAEALLRRLRRDGDLPRVHPLVDLCNALSVAYAVPVAAFDLTHVTGSLTVRPASGQERYLTFSGEVEHPAEGEIVFADEAGAAHARRWATRQSGVSAVRADSAEILVVAEAHHAGAAEDMAALAAELGADLAELWGVDAPGSVLTAATPFADLA